jgi:PII-like signaling protein/predicted transcriptional regulator
MTATEPVQRVRIYLNERDTADGQPLYLVTLERLRREGATGASAIRGIAGFGAGRRLGGMAELSQSVPIVVEWVDRPDRVARVLPALDDLLPEALITIEELRVYRAVLRSAGMFGGRSVGETLDRNARGAPPEASLTEAIEFLVRARQPLLPVLAADGRVSGVLGDAELARYGAPALRVLATLPAADRAALLAPLPAVTVGEAASPDPRTIYVETTIAQTVSVLLEWGLDALPASDRDGRFAGLFGTEQALRAAVASEPAPSGNIRSADPPPPVSLIMQMLVPTVTPANPLSATLTLLLAAPGGVLVVVNGWSPQGLLDAAQVAAQLPDTARIAWFEALRTRTPPPAEALEAAAALTAGDLARTPPPLIRTRDTQNDAIRMMLDGTHEQLVAVDDEGRLAGLVTRRGLLRAVAQSES